MWGCMWPPDVLGNIYLVVGTSVADDAIRSEFRKVFGFND